MNLNLVFKTLLLVLLVTSCREKPLKEGFYRINGTVSGIDLGTIYLLNSSNSLDTIQINDGSFTIERKIEDIIEKVTLVKESNSRAMHQKNTLSLFIEPTLLPFFVA